MTGEELKEFIKSRGESYAEFGALVGVSASSIAKAVSSGKVSAQIAAGVALVAQISELEKQQAALKRVAGESERARQIKQAHKLVQELANLEIFKDF